MCEIWANQLLPKALKSCPKSNKSPNLVTLAERLKKSAFRCALVLMQVNDAKTICWLKRSFLLSLIHALSLSCKFNYFGLIVLTGSANDCRGRISCNWTLQGSENRRKTGFDFTNGHPYEKLESV